jgi:replication factor A2
MDTQDEYSLLPALQQQIVRYLISQDAKDGLHVATIARGLGMDKSEAQKLRSVTLLLDDVSRVLIRELYLHSEALDALMDGGHLYNTIDETHFAVSR